MRKWRCMLGNKGSTKAGRHSRNHRADCRAARLDGSARVVTSDVPSECDTPAGRGTRPDARAPVPRPVTTSESGNACGASMAWWTNVRAGPTGTRWRNSNQVIPARESVECSRRIAAWIACVWLIIAVYVAGGLGCSDHRSVGMLGVAAMITRASAPVIRITSRSRPTPRYSDRHDRGLLIRPIVVAKLRPQIEVFGVAALIGKPAYVLSELFFGSEAGRQGSPRRYRGEEWDGARLPTTKPVFVPAGAT